LDLKYDIDPSLLLTTSFEHHPSIQQSARAVTF